MVEAFRRILYIGVPKSRKKKTYHSIDSRLLWHLCIFLFQSTCSFHGIPSSGPDKQITWLDFQDLFFVYYCHLLTSYANSLNLDQVQQNVGSDLDPTCLLDFQDLFFLLLPSADKLCKQFGPRLGPTKRRVWSRSDLFARFSGSLFFYYCHLLTSYANSLDPDQVRQNVGSDLDPTCLPLCRYKCNHVGMFQILKEIISRQQNIMNYYVISTKVSM